MRAADQPAAGGGGGKPKLSWIAKATIIALIIPIAFTVAGLSLNASRILFLILVPVLGIGLISGRYGRIVITDVLIMFFCAWMVLVIFLKNNDVWVSFGGMQAVTLIGGYLAGRAAIRSVEDFQALARFYAGVVVLLLPFAAFEAFTGKPIIMETINDFFGAGTAKYTTGHGDRLGLDRARVVFGHPIHFGLFCSGALSLYVVGLMNQEPAKRRILVCAGILGSIFFSVSSGPLLAAMFQCALIVYMIMFKDMKPQWMILLVGSGTMFMLLEVASSRPALFVVAEKLAFNPATAQIRRTLWDAGTDAVSRSPIFGFGYNWWGWPSWMSGSIDNYWLALAINFGLPGCYTMLTAYFLVMILAGRRKLTRGSDAYNARVAVTFVLISLFMTLATVAIWGEVLSMVYFLLGSTGFLLQKDVMEAAEAKDTAPIPPDPRRRGGRRGGAGSPGSPGGAPEPALPGGLTPATPRGPRYTRFPTTGGQTARAVRTVRRG